MKRVFKVTLHLNDMSKNDYRIATKKDDQDAREIAVQLEIKSFEHANLKFPGVEMAEVEFVSYLDAG